MNVAVIVTSRLIFYPIFFILDLSLTFGLCGFFVNPILGHQFQSWKYKFTARRLFEEVFWLHFLVTLELELYWKKNYFFHFFIMLAKSS